MRTLQSIKTLCITSCIAISVSAAQAGVINGGSLLTAADADQLEVWAALGDQDFTHIYTGLPGDPTTGFHAAVDGVGSTFTLALVDRSGSNHLIGGYTEQDWGGATGYALDSNAFVYNLSMGFKQDVVQPQHAIYRNPTYAPTFGHHEFHLGRSGTIDGGNPYVHKDQGYHSVTNTLGFSGGGVYYVDVLRVEVYTSAAAVPASAPATGPLMAVLCCGLLSRLRKSS